MLTSAVIYHERPRRPILRQFQVDTSHNNELISNTVERLYGRAKLAHAEIDSEIELGSFFKLITDLDFTDLD